jgi:hypothetical protein
MRKNEFINIKGVKKEEFSSVCIFLFIQHSNKIKKRLSLATLSSRRLSFYAIIFIFSDMMMILNTNFNRKKKNTEASANMNSTHKNIRKMRERQKKNNRKKS